MGDRERRLQVAENIATSQRNYRRARDRALARLGQMYPDDYKELYDEERKKDEKEGKVWSSLAGRGSPVRSRRKGTRKPTRPRRRRGRS